MAKVHYTSAAGVDTVLETVRLGAVTGLVTQANQGTLGTCQIEVPDPGGVIAIKGLKRLYHEEPGYGVLWNGYIGNRDISRGPEFHKGADRLITVNLVDLNTLLDNYIIQDPADPNVGKRPAETDVARIAWLLTSGFLPQVHDHGLVDTVGGVDMDATDYTGQTAGDVVRDCGEHSGRQWFVYYDQTWVTDSHKDALFYKSPFSDAFPCTLRFSNVPGDADGVTTFEMCSDPQPTQHTDPSRVVSGLKQDYSGGYVFRRDTDIGLTTHTDFYVREKVAQSANTKSAAVATAMADRQLKENSTEEDSASFSVLLPKEYAPLVQAGMRVSCKFSHFEPAYRDWWGWRIETLAVHQDDPETHEWYRLDIEATPAPVVTGLHQVVVTSGTNYGALSGPGGDALLVNGIPTAMSFIGAATAPVSLHTYTVAQDTDGYARRIAAPGNALDAGDPAGDCIVRELQIPLGLGGQYAIRWEELVVASISGTYVAPYEDIDGNPVPYVPSHFPTGIGACLMTAGSAAVSLLVNGVIVHTETDVVAGPTGFATGQTNADFSLHLDDLDIVTLSVVATGMVYNVLGNGFGAGVPGMQQGCLVLTRTGD